jgi:hypothetical protein
MDKVENPVIEKSPNDTTTEESGDDKMKDDNMGGEWSTHGRDEKCWSEILKGRNNLESLGRIIPYNFEYKSTPYFSVEKIRKRNLLTKLNV